jgi:DNA topoisomerase I
MATSTYKIEVPKTLMDQKYMLGVAEKPTAAKRLAQSLNQTGKINKFMVKVSNTVDNIKLPPIEVYSCDTDYGKLLIVPALGHLFTLIQNSSGYQYPVYDFRWVPITESLSSRKEPSKHQRRIEATIETIRELIKKASKLIVMTDYDQEGEVIGGVIFQQLSPKKLFNQAKRMKFSSLTNKEVLESYKNIFESDSSIDYGLYNKGLMRHYLDWLWGINLSRALMLSLKYTSGRYQTLSTGRVQGPTLSFVAEKQYEIDTFVPIPYFKLFAKIAVNNVTYDLTYGSKNIEVKKDALNFVNENKTKKAKVNEITIKKRLIDPPVPYNLSELQKDAYRYFKLSPRRTLNAAENLYLAALISYPRTSSEKFPPGFDHDDILNKLSTQNEFGQKIVKLRKINKKLIAKEGKKIDPAHPAICPTGQKPSKIASDAKKIYELIVNRYLATFGKPVELENTKINYLIGKLPFYHSGTTIKKSGWWEFQEPSTPPTDSKLPKVSKGTEVELKKLESEELFTKPPAGYNESSLLKQMEDAEIGTKATRADIIQAIIDRKYVEGNPLKLTRLGRIIYEVLKDYSPKVLSVELSRELEQMGEYIEQTINSPETNGFPLTLQGAIMRGINILHSLLFELQSNEFEVGFQINRELMYQSHENYQLGLCPKCNTGQLTIISPKISGKRFVGCSEYFNDKKCENTFPLPQKGKIQSIDQKCPIDGYPQIKVYSGKRPWTMCVNYDCESRIERQKEIEQRKAMMQKVK